MEGEFSSFLDDGSLPLNPVDGLPEPRQLQVDQVSQGEIFRSASDLGGRQFFVFGKLLLDNLLELDTSGDF